MYENTQRNRYPRTGTVEVRDPVQVDSYGNPVSYSGLVVGWHQRPTQRTAKGRLAGASAPSLFDGVDVVDPDFAPRQRFGPRRRTEQDHGLGPQTVMPSWQTPASSDCFSILSLHASLTPSLIQKKGRWKRTHASAGL